MRLDRLDHLVLTVRDPAATCDFYRRVLGMEVVTFGQGRVALRFGPQKINLHPAGQAFSLTAGRPTPGSGDLCFLTAEPAVSENACPAGCRLIFCGPNRSATRPWPKVTTSMPRTRR